METDSFCILTINLQQPCEDSFIAALDEARLPHGRIQSFCTSAHSSTITEVISQPSHAMPWSTITAALFCWLKESVAREIFISGENNQTTAASQCSPVTLKQLLMSSTDITVMQSSNPGKICA